jgi:hypothetical protein
MKQKQSRIIRWVGFDMDECIGSLISLWPYFDYMLTYISRSVRTELFKDMVKKISDANTASRIWIMRPELDKILTLLAQAQQEGKIYGCFVLSNNGSALLVQTAIEIMNYRAKQLTSTPYDLFIAGWYRNSPCRNNSMVKDFNTIQNCLKHEKLPTLASKDHLLFYDDLNHDLASEIQHYVRVPPYYNTTPSSLIFDTIQSVLSEYNVSSKIIDKSQTQANYVEEHDIRADKELVLNPPAQSAKMEMNVFVNGFMRFINSNKVKHNFTRKAFVKKSKQSKKGNTRKKLRT